MKQRKAKWMRGALLALPVVVFSAALFRAGQQRRELLRLFTPVPGTKKSRSLLGSMWRSSHEVVCLPNNSYGTALVSVDARTGKRTPLPPLPANQAIPYVFGVSVSPDGKWLLWPGGTSGWNAMSLDGKRFVRRPRASNSLSDLKVAWLPDSNGWVEARENQPINKLVNGLLTTVEMRTYLRICSLNTALVKDIDLPRSRVSAIGDFQITQNGDAVFSCSEPVSVRFVTVPLANPTAVREQNITPPFKVGNGHFIRGTLVSPRGDRIAWTFQSMNLGGTTESVWLSDSKGQNFRRLTPELDMRTMAPVYLHWMPDSQHLSFWRDDSLFVLNIQ